MQAGARRTVPVGVRGLGRRPREHQSEAQWRGWGYRAQMAEPRVAKDTPERSIGRRSSPARARQLYGQETCGVTVKDMSYATSASAESPEHIRSARRQKIHWARCLGLEAT